MLHEEITTVDATLKDNLVATFNSFTTVDDILKTKVDNKMTFIDIFDLCNIQEGSYRTIKDSDILLHEACELFGRLNKKDFPIFRGTENLDEFKSIEQSGQDLIGHVLSFTANDSMAENFGDAQIEAIDADEDVDCLDFQKAVSTVCQALTDLDFQHVKQFITSKASRSGLDNSDMFMTFKKEYLENKASLDNYGLRISDFSSKDSILAANMLKTRKAAYSKSSTMFGLAFLRLFIKKHLEEEFQKFKNNNYAEDFSIVDMIDEQEILVNSGTFFEVKDAKFDSGEICKIDVVLRKERVVNKPFDKFKDDASLFSSDGSSFFNKLEDAIKEAMTTKTLKIPFGCENFQNALEKLSLKFTEAESGDEENVKIQKIVDFFESNGIDTAIVDDNETSLENQTFNNMPFKTVYLPSNLQRIGSWAFFNSGIETLDIPKNVRHIGRHAFEKSRLQQITFLGDNALEDVGQYAFYECNDLKTISLPNSTSGIFERAFYNSGLEEIVFPENLEMIGDFAFKNSRLRKVVFNDKLKTIKIGAFLDTSLDDVELPESIEDFVPANAFQNLKKMTLKCRYEAAWPLVSGNIKSLEEVVVREEDLARSSNDISILAPDGHVEVKALQNLSESMKMWLGILDLMR